MLGFVNRLQVVVFGLMAQHISDQTELAAARAEAEHYKELLLKVYASNELLLKAINGEVEVKEERYG